MSPARPKVALATARGFWELDQDGGPLVAALDDVGITGTPQIWDDPAVHWQSFDLVVLRSVWDYADRGAEFLSWIDAVSAAAPLANPAEIVRWNTDKHYLADLGAAGLDVVPTVFVDSGTSDTAEQIRTALSSFDEVVVKPTVSAGSRDAGRWTPERHAEAAAHAQALLDAGKDVMFQPYISASGGHSETDVICFSGVPSHAVSKGPMLANEGDVSRAPFATEQIAPAALTAKQAELATASLAAVADRFGVDAPVYGRVDMLATDGSPVLLEVELTEPSLFLPFDAAAAGRAASAIAARLEDLRTV